MTSQAKVPQAFFWRRFHSLMGLWLVIYLIEHLLTNSQAALWIDDDGSGFVRAVNFLQHLPYLHVIEIVFLGIPFAIHIVWGIKRLQTSKMNSFTSDGTKPILNEYPRNRNFSWQRITSWILLFALIIHVVQFRIIHYPSFAKLGHEDYYMVRVSLDDGLYTVAKRLNVALYDEDKINQQKLEWRENVEGDTTMVAGFFASVRDFFKGIYTAPQDPELESNQIRELLMVQEKEQQKAFLDALSGLSLAPGEVVAVAPDFGTAELLVVRETFKIPLMLVFYTLFVLAAVFHAFNGLWTFLITWGVTLTERSQNMMMKASIFLMILIAFLGLAAIWGTYSITLNQ